MYLAKFKKIIPLLVGSLFILSGCSGLKPKVFNEQNFATGQFPQAVASGANYNYAAANLPTASEPKQVTLLLPLSGRLATTGQAIRNGFLTAYYYTKAQGQVVPQIKLMDTNQGDVKTLYQKAIAQGADFVVGPLTKPKVAAIAAANDHLITVPTLALNTLDDYQNHTSANLYQFGLAPQDEALQVAYKIKQAGLKRVLIIAPVSSWGNNLVNIFNFNFQKIGGVIVGSMNYRSSANFASEIKQLLQADQSQARSKALTNILNEKVNATLYRRQDFDAIFLIATPSDARQIRPLLKFYYAGNVPIYATSLVYSGAPHPSSDIDLDGIIFCDLPWVLQNPAKLPPYLQEPEKQIARTWPHSSKTANKLYALGIDAYNLMNFLNTKNALPSNGFAGATGVLFLDRYQHIYRRLTWAKFQNGRPELLP